MKETEMTTTESQQRWCMGCWEKIHTNNRREKAKVEMPEENVALCYRVVSSWPLAIHVTEWRRVKNHNECFEADDWQFPITQLACNEEENSKFY